MTRTAKVTILVFMLALVPLRALAAVTTGFCALGHEHNALHHHGPAPEPGSDDQASCDVCVEHCSSASFAPSAHRVALIAADSGGCIVSDKRIHVDFVADGLDRPPLAL